MIPPRLKKLLVTGTLILVPLMLTLICFQILLGLLLNYILSPVATGIGFQIHPQWLAYLLAVIVLIVLVLVVGWAGSSLIGQHILLASEEVINQIPVFKSVYSAMKEVLNAFAAKDRPSFRKFVMVRQVDGAQFGFLTGEFTLKTGDEAPRPMRVVYLATNHLWFGEVRAFPAEQVIDTQLSVEEGVRLLLSAGAAVPHEVARRA